MQLKLQRSQRTGGVLGATVFFCLDVRADYTSEEQENIRKYQLGGQLLYSSQAARKHQAMAEAALGKQPHYGALEQTFSTAKGLYSKARAALSLNISIASLGRGHHIECKDIEELIEAEEAVRSACKSVTRYLEVAQTFDGSELVIEYEKGEERVHTHVASAPLLSVEIEEASHARPALPQGTGSNSAVVSGPDRDGDTPISLKDRWLEFEDRILRTDFAQRRLISRHQIRWMCAALALLVVFLFLGL